LVHKAIPMMIGATPEVYERIERQLAANCPSPEGDLNTLSLLFAGLDESERSARLRLLAVDIDDLVAQARWHFGQSLLLFEIAPDALKPAVSDEAMMVSIEENGMPSAVLLLLRPYIKDADKVLFRDLSEPRRGGTAAGWLFHMMLDSALYRTIAAMDRIALVLWILAGLPISDSQGRPSRVYFRSRKVAAIGRAIPSEHASRLLQLASGPLWEYVLAYRDGLSHSAKAYSRIAGSLPAHEWIGQAGTRFVQPADKWDAELLFALGRGTYDQLLQAMPLMTAICQAQLPTPSAKESS
jgi:hypothetical protein